jgi:hypothetical protein
MSQDSNMVREMLPKIESTISENYRDPVSVAEKRPSSWAKKVEAFAQLQTVLKTSWRTSLSQINEIATNETQKAIFFKAAQILPREEYIAFVTAASEQVASGSISKQLFKWALFPSEIHLREMWTEAPPSESIKQLARQAKMVLSEDTNQSNFFDHVLSGKVAADNRQPEQTSSSDNAVKSLGSGPDHPLAPSVQAPVAPTTSDTKTTPQPKPSKTTSEEPTASTPWSFIVVLVVAATGLLWLLLKGRK